MFGSMFGGDKSVPSKIIAAPEPGSTMRIDIVSDTHGYLSPELLEELAGADLIVHAGDFCSLDDYNYLCGIAPLQGCLGNNDYRYEYPPEVGRLVRFEVGDTRWQVAHYREDLDLKCADVAVCGHTHKPYVEERRGRIVLNPGSPTFPRTTMGPTMARVIVGEGGRLVSADIIQLGES